MTPDDKIAITVNSWQVLIGVYCLISYVYMAWDGRKYLSAAKTDKEKDVARGIVGIMFLIAPVSFALIGAVILLHGLLLLPWFIGTCLEGKSKE